MSISYIQGYKENPITTYVKENPMTVCVYSQVHTCLRVCVNPVLSTLSRYSGLYRVISVLGLFVSLTQIRPISLPLVGSRLLVSQGRPTETEYGNIHPHLSIFTPPNVSSN